MASIFVNEQGAVRNGWRAVAFLLRPTYIATEIVTAAGTTGGYSFVSDSVSKLGQVGCSEAYCSPRHEVMNGSFMAYGVLLALEDVGAEQVLGSVDAMKLRSSMTLFAHADPSEPVFRDVLERLYDGHEDERTVQLLVR